MLNLSSKTSSSHSNTLSRHELYKYLLQLTLTQDYLKLVTSLSQQNSQHAATVKLLFDQQFGIIVTVIADSIQQGFSDESDAILAAIYQLKADMEHPDDLGVKLTYLRAFIESFQCAEVNARFFGECTVFISQNQKQTLDAAYEQVKSVINESGHPEFLGVMYALLETFTVSANLTTFNQEEIEHIHALFKDYFNEVKGDNINDPRVTRAIMRLDLLKDLFEPLSFVGICNILLSHLAIENFLPSVALLCINNQSLFKNYDALSALIVATDDIQCVLRNIKDLRRIRKSDPIKSQIDGYIERFASAFQKTMRLVMPREDLLKSLNALTVRIQNEAHISAQMQILSKNIRILEQNIELYRQLIRYINIIKAINVFLTQISDALNKNKMDTSAKKILIEIQVYFRRLAGSERQSDAANYIQTLQTIDGFCSVARINMKSLVSQSNSPIKDPGLRLIREIYSYFLTFSQALQPAQFALLDRQEIIDKWKSFGADSLSKQENWFSLLGITREDIKAIPTLPMRKRFLRYVFLRSQLEFSLLCQRSRSPHEQNILQTLRGCYEDLLRHLDDSSEHDDLLEFLPPGISELGVANRPMDLIRLENKQAGVEPGFIAASIPDIVFELENRLPDYADRLTYFRRFDGDFARLYEESKAHLPRYLVKLDYQLDSSGRAAPNSADLSRTITVSQALEFNPYYGQAVILAYTFLKTDPPGKKNLAAVEEVLCNDLARASGMTTQMQTLIQTTYPNGALKLMPKGEWAKDAKILGPLHGGAANYRNYIVQNTVHCPSGIKYLSSTPASDLATQFMTFVVQGDYDAIGDSGGNKLVVGDRLFGIDFGHAFAGISPLPSLLTKSLHLPPGKLSKACALGKPFKNFSIFDDFTRVELLKGLLIQAKLAGRNVNSRLISAYDEEFQRLYAEIKPHALENICDAYIKIFKIQAKSCPAAHKPDYDEIIKRVETIKGYAIASRDALLDRFSQHLELPIEVHSILENLEKIVLGPTNTSMRSEDETVLLRHLRCTNESKLVEWDAKLSSAGEWEFSATSFTSRDTAKKAQEALVKFGIQNSQIENKTLKFIWQATELNTLKSLVDETNIKIIYHLDDYQISEILRPGRDFIEQSKAMSAPVLTLTVERAITVRDLQTELDTIREIIGDLYTTHQLSLVATLDSDTSTINLDGPEYVLSKIDELSKGQGWIGTLFALNAHLLELKCNFTDEIDRMKQEYELAETPIIFDWNTGLCHALDIDFPMEFCVTAETANHELRNILDIRREQNLLQQSRPSGPSCRK